MNKIKYSLNFLNISLTLKLAFLKEGQSANFVSENRFLDKRNKRSKTEYKSER